MDDLLAEHHAVIYAVGVADRPVAPDIPGALNLPESRRPPNSSPGTTVTPITPAGHSTCRAPRGHCRQCNRARRRTHPHDRPDRLADTDIAPHALKAPARQSRTAEVVVVGRRGIEQFSSRNPELVGLCSTPGVDVVVRDEIFDVADTDPRAAILRGCGLPGGATVG